MMFEQVGPFLRNAMTQVSVVRLTSDEKNQITELAERMKEVLDAAAARQQHQAK